jgi:hypothetical protein
LGGIQELIEERFVTRLNNAGSDRPGHGCHRSGYGRGSTSAGEGHSVRGRERLSESLSNKHGQAQSKVISKSLRPGSWAVPSSTPEKG